jgi:hypothetical protein
MYAAASLALILGIALQLQQNELSVGWTYASMLLACLADCLITCLDTRLMYAHNQLFLRSLIFALAFTLPGFAVMNLCSLHYTSDAPDPLEGRDVLATGVATDSPQAGMVGLWFRMEVGAATKGGTPVHIPSLIEVAWYGGVQPNAMSCVLRISTGCSEVGTSALLIGDIEASHEQPLLTSGENLHADVLLVPHHGIETSRHQDVEHC